MNNEKALKIATALAEYYGVDLPEFDSHQDCLFWIKSILSKNNAQLKRCPRCSNVLAKKMIQGRLRHFCRGCGRIYNRIEKTT